jgi:hypothetical protein
LFYGVEGFIGEGFLHFWGVVDDAGALGGEDGFAVVFLFVLGVDVAGLGSGVYCLSVYVILITWIDLHQFLRRVESKERIL